MFPACNNSGGSRRCPGRSPGCGRLCSSWKKAARLKVVFSFYPLILVCEEGRPNLGQSPLIRERFFMEGMEQQLISTFYTSFQQGDWKGMLSVYHPDIFF